MGLLFYYLDGVKHGPVDDEQLRKLIFWGVIVPQTPVETESGIRGPAGQIPGVFEPDPPPIQEPNNAETNRREKSKKTFVVPGSVRIGLAVLVCLTLVVGLFVFFRRSPDRNRAVSLPAVSSEEAKRKPGERLIVKIKEVDYSFRWCPSGTFTMGSPFSETDRSYKETRHSVTLRRGFWLLETEVSQAMWKSVAGNNPSGFTGDDLPVENVSWLGCQEFIDDLNDSGLCLPGVRFCLPTEAQWEYACRAGTATAFYFGRRLTGRRANCKGMELYGTSANYPGKTTPVRSYSPNAWGLYDMHGNVWEWCSNWYGESPRESETDPAGPESGTERVGRGGGWCYHASDCRSAVRGVVRPGFRSNYLGFRLALIPDK